VKKIYSSSGIGLRVNLYTANNFSDERGFFLVYKTTSFSETLNLYINIQSVTSQGRKSFTLHSKEILKPNTYLNCENYFKLSESVRCCGMERIVERTKVMRISRQISPVQSEKSKATEGCKIFQLLL
jgi:hypothetical protein